MFEEQATRTAEILLILGLALIGLSLLVKVINPIAIAQRTKDTARITDVTRLINAINSFQTIHKQLPNCDFLPDCPTQFTLSGKDPLSLALKKDELLQNIPRSPQSNNPKLCNYQVKLFPSWENKFYIQWCYESWTAKKVAKARNKGVDCE